VRHSLGSGHYVSRIARARHVGVQSSVHGGRGRWSAHGADACQAALDVQQGGEQHGCPAAPVTATLAPLTNTHRLQATSSSALPLETAATAARSRTSCGAAWS
jgi:hypothetical protein